MATILSVRLVISGRVQAVAYRAWTVQEARRRGLAGWVRNRRDGTVEALLHGESRAIDDLTRACRHGPALARVDKVHAEPAEWDGAEGFRIE